MSFKDFVENSKIEVRIENLEVIRKQINQSWVKKKINSYLDRMGNIFTVEQVKQQILENDIVASFFAKEPGRQNISEELVQKYLKIKKLSGQGEEDIRFDRTGNIHIGEGSKALYTKNADFYLHNVYITQKYTGRSTGGAQDNQFKEVVDFLTCGSINYKVGALVDGWYWEENGKKDELIEAFADNKNVYIFSADEYYEYGGIIFG